MATRYLGVVSLLAVLLVASFAAAQTVTLTLAPSQEAVDVTGGQSTTVSVDVQMKVDGIMCAQAADLPVNLTVAGSQVNGAANPAELTYTLPQGIHNSQVPQEEAYSQNESTSLEILVPGGQSSGFSEDLTITASFPGATLSPPDGDKCSANLEPAENSATVTVNVQPDVTSTDDTSTDDDQDTGNDADGNGTGPAVEQNDEENGMPFGTWMAPLALLSAAFVLRRD